MKLYIRNMACESCKVVVRHALKQIGVEPVKVELGEAEIKGLISEKKKRAFDSAIKKAGLQLVESKSGVLIDEIKAIVAEYINNKKNIKVNLSDYLSKKLNYDYAYLSNYFSTMQASTIEQFSISLKIEKIKELLLLEDHTLTEIAKLLDYSSAAHLSAQFKKVVGLPASHFRKLKIIRRNTIQSL
ncbi:MAG TPA: AraC family transcriptional regulator [Puia sp.]|nr:AraC family transcriptional regulator [Puia sp.]